MLVLLWFVGMCSLLCFVLDPLRVGVVDDSGMCLLSSVGLLPFVLSVSCVVFLILSKLVPECLDVISSF